MLITLESHGIFDIWNFCILISFLTLSIHLYAKIVTRVCRPSFWAGRGILVKTLLNHTVYFDQILHSYTFFEVGRENVKEKNI